ncbi:MAG: DUF1566 domain-containing protein [Hyphomicrobiales bacterium]|nr:DUF1566 domain-containing protein [Hyphomicrobiales bacterium]
MNDNNHSNKKTRRLEAIFAAACGLGLLVWLTGAHETAGALISDLRSLGPDQCASIGDVCPDGSVYAGRTPDGNMFMFATPEDAPVRLAWSNESAPARSGLEACELLNPYYGQTTAPCITGQANTAFLAHNGSGEPPFPAARYCGTLDAHGRGDWYLPAITELEALFENRERIGEFSVSRDWSKEPIDWRSGTYWSSSEPQRGGGRLAIVFDFLSPPEADHVYVKKDEALRIRCVRKESTADFSFDR